MKHFIKVLKIMGIGILGTWALHSYANEDMMVVGTHAEMQGYTKHVGLPSRIDSHGERVFIFSPRYKQWAAYDSRGVRVAYGKANGGSHYCKDVGRACRTPQGVHRIIRKGTSACRSSKYPKPRGGAPMPYCMFFHGAGYAIHGSPQIGSRNTSHGCVRVKTSAAKWLHQYFLKPGTKVVVQSY